MQKWRQNAYFLEFVLVAIPVALFMIVSLGMLIGLATQAPRAALKLLLLWIGGCMGTYALWSMYFRLYDEQHSLKLKELPLLSLGCGICANVVSVLYFIFGAHKPTQVLISLAFLIPVLVSIHWAILLTSGDSVGPRLPNSRLEPDASRRST